MEAVRSSFISPSADEQGFWLFDRWTEPIPMTMTEGSCLVFRVICDLPLGRHQSLEELGLPRPQRRKWAHPIALSLNTAEFDRLGLQTERHDVFNDCFTDAWGVIFQNNRVISESPGPKRT
ncbi:hypothetical protein C3L33_14510, partial [Rhododendron williamsianum]